MKTIVIFGLYLSLSVFTFAARPNIVLVMTDDQGWGQTGYYNHPALKTPNLDAMAANGLRFDRFYAGAPVCSPTRASVLTGRCNDRSGVPSHGHALRLQEKTLSRALKDRGYATGHFGKWHLNGIRGPGVPVLATDNHNPGAFGFDEWLTVSNFFDRDPIMSRNGKFVEFKGDSSEIIVDEALAFIGKQARAKTPSLTVIWYGTPHSPFRASAEDAAAFDSYGANSAQHYGELVAMDRSVGALRKGLRELGIADDSLVWFNSDNGGLQKIAPDTVGGLRGHKGSVFEGGLRVPGIIEWPAEIKTPRATSYPAATMDIFPTVVDILGLPSSVMLKPIDGISLKPLFAGEIGERKTPIPFRFLGRGALVDNRYKLLTQSIKGGAYVLYDLEKDPGETTNLADQQPAIVRRMRDAFEAFDRSVEASVAGKDYPEGHDYLSRQLITYIGNKRAFLNQIAAAVEQVKRRLGKARLRVFDVFAGSGFVSRLFKAHASLVVSNDIEDYAATIARCYLRNRSDVDFPALARVVEDLNARARADSFPPGFIEEMYAPKDETRITKDDRVFYTRENARRLDDYRRLIHSAPAETRDLLLAPLLGEASVHANTAGVFKGFYKNRETGVGQFGGTGSDALDRITGRIVLEPPVLSRFECDHEVLQEDANKAAQHVRDLDLAYIDPPHNQHPYPVQKGD